jgi:hypothetical protein
MQNRLGDHFGESVGGRVFSSSPTTTGNQGIQHGKDLVFSSFPLSLLGYAAKIGRLVEAYFKFKTGNRLDHRINFERALTFEVLLRNSSSASARQMVAILPTAPYLPDLFHQSGLTSNRSPAIPQCLCFANPARSTFENDRAISLITCSCGCKHKFIHFCTINFITLVISERNHQSTAFF